MGGIRLGILRSPDAFATALSGDFERLTEDAIEMIVSASQTVKPLHVVEDIAEDFRSGGVVRLVAAFLNPLLLERVELGLDDRVGPAEASRVHSGHDRGLARTKSPRVRYERVEDQLFGEARPHRSADVIACAEFHPHWQLTQALASENVDGVGNLGVVSSFEVEFARETVRRNHGWQTEVGACCFVGSYRADFMATNESGHRMSSTRLSELAQVEVRSRLALDATARGTRGATGRLQAFTFPRAVGGCLLESRIEIATRNLEETAQHR